MDTLSDWMGGHGQIGTPWSASERQEAQLELDALRNRKPVQAVPQHVFDVVVLLGADE